MGLDGDRSTVGERVRQARLSAGLSQDELGERVGLDHTMIAKIEAGRRRVDALELVRLASALDVLIDDLLEPRPAVRAGPSAGGVRGAAGRRARHAAGGPVSAVGAGADPRVAVADAVAGRT